MAFADPDLEHVFHRLFTTFKMIADLSERYGALPFEEITQFEEDQRSPCGPYESGPSRVSGGKTFPQHGACHRGASLFPASQSEDSHAKQNRNQDQPEKGSIGMFRKGRDLVIKHGGTPGQDGEIG